MCLLGCLGVRLGPGHRQAAGTHPQRSQAVDHVVVMATITHVWLTNYVTHKFLRKFSIIAQFYVQKSGMSYGSQCF